MGKCTYGEGEEEGSAEASVKKTGLGTVGELATAEVQLEMKTADGAKLFMQGVTFPVDGKMLHVATVSSSRNLLERRSHNDSPEGLDIQKPARKSLGAARFRLTSRLQR